MAARPLSKRELATVFSTDAGARDLRALAEAILALRSEQAWQYSATPARLEETPVPYVHRHQTVSPEWLTAKAHEKAMMALGSLALDIPVDGRFSAMYGKLCEDAGLSFNDGRGASSRRLTIWPATMTRERLRVWATLVVAHAHLGRTCRIEIATPAGLLVVSGLGTPVSADEDPDGFSEGLAGLMQAVTPTGILRDVTRVLVSYARHLAEGGGPIPRGAWGTRPRGASDLAVYPVTPATREQWVSHMLTLITVGTREVHLSGLRDLLSAIEGLSDADGHCPQVVEHLRAARALALSNVCGLRDRLGHAAPPDDQD